MDNRLREVLSQWAAQPTASIPADYGGRAELVGACRLFDNEKTTFENILAPHEDATRRRMAAVRSAIAKLRPPQRPERKWPAVSSKVVLVREVNPPPGDEPVE